MYDWDPWIDLRPRTDEIISNCFYNMAILLKRLIVDQASNRISCQFSIFDAILLLNSGRDESQNCDQVISEYHWWWQFHVSVHELMSACPGVCP